jgi:hypothetical protein
MTNPRKTAGPLDALRGNEADHRKALATDSSASSSESTSEPGKEQSPPLRPNVASLQRWIDLSA